MLSIGELEAVVTEARALSFAHKGEPAWETEPVSEAELTAAAEHLGITFPEDLANLFRVAGIGEVINYYLTLLPLTPNDEFPESLFVHRSKFYQEHFGPNDVLWDQAGIHPSDKVLDLTTYGQFGYLYETKGEHAGKILCFDVLRVPVVQVLAPSLENYLLYIRDCLRLEDNFVDRKARDVADCYGIQDGR